MFGRDKEKRVDPSRVQQAISQASTVSGVRNLSVQQDGQIFKIHGQADSIAAKQEAFRRITDAVGDSSGVVNFIEVSDERTGQVKAAGLDPLRVGTTTSTGSRTHVVKKGETLSHLAQKYYGKASQYNKIFEANRDQLNDPDKIREGQTLRIPD